MKVRIVSQFNKETGKFLGFALETSGDSICLEASPRILHEFGSAGRTRCFVAT